MRKSILTLVCLASVAAILQINIGQSIPQPGATISRGGTNQVLVRITNGVSTANYEVHRTHALANPSFPWVLNAVGTQGQTNFTLDIGLEDEGFFKVGVGTDWDGDSIPNWADAVPTNGSVGVLSLTITYPANGSVVE